MHLDTVFNILSDKCCIMLSEMMGDDSSTRRTVDEYVQVEGLVANSTHMGGSVAESRGTLKESSPNSDEVLGTYRLQRRDVEFAKYVRQKGFAIIEVSGEEQLNYGCNILNLGNNHVVSIEKTTARRIASSPHFSGKVEFLNFEGVSCMYGGVHCASQVFRSTSDCNPVNNGAL